MREQQNCILEIRLNLLLVYSSVVSFLVHVLPFERVSLFTSVPYLLLCLVYSCALFTPMPYLLLCLVYFCALFTPVPYLLICVLFSPVPQNPQADLQAQDRCHRIGQTKPVVVYRFVTANTIDQQVVETACSKRKLEQMVIHKGESVGQLSSMRGVLSSL